MTIIRVEHSKDYTCIANKAIRDKRLSFKARGLHHLLLSYPDGWKVNIKHLENQSDKDARASVSTALSELETLGYISREQSRSKDGRIGAIEYVVRELPRTVSRKTARGKTARGKSDRILSTDSDQLLNLSNTQAPPLPGAPPPTPNSVCVSSSSKKPESTQVSGEDRESPWRENSSRYQKKLDSSENLLWETSRSPREFDTGFEEWMGRSLAEYPAYRDLMPGEKLTKVRKHISAGKYDEKRRDALEIEWEAYQQSKAHKPTEKPLRTPAKPMNCPLMVPTPEEKEQAQYQRQVNMLNRLPENTPPHRIPSWIGSINESDIPPHIKKIIESSHVHI